ncbi:MAG: pilus assembly protein [Alphaproteobacteria bacterium]|nr:pilus assembly protein [Alphaproteobacteria bacterium]
MLRWLVRLLRHQDGAALVEFALILPIMITLFLGAFEVTRVVAADMRLENAAQSVADMIAQQTNVTSTTMTNFCNGGQLSMTPLAGTSLKIAVAEVTNTGAGLVVDWSDTTCNSATAISNATTLATSLVPNTNDSVIIVQATYAYTSPISYVLSSSYTLTQTAFQRPYNVGTITHS